ncbi:MAG: zinc-binding dehydrogenase [Chloroflexi bacterium]|nr:zinc-binding dehydrogenase [Chloroflexota bacterium]
MNASQTKVAKQAVYTGVGGPELMQIVEKPLPEPGPGQARVRVLTAGVAFADLMVRFGTYPSPPPPGSPLGYDIVGVVDKLGAGVTNLYEGQMVGALLPHFGGYTEIAVVPEEWLVPVSDGIDPAEAVCLILNYLTAVQMLEEMADAQPDERLLVHSAAGGVGTAVLQLGRLKNLEMIGTASAGKHELVASLGATPIDYRHEDFVERIPQLAPDGLDIVLDPIGGDTLTRSYKLLRRGGRLINFGLISAREGGKSAFLPNLLNILARKVWPDGRKIMFNRGLPPFAEKHNDWYRDTLTHLFALLQEGQIEPVIGAKLPLTEAARAHEMLETGAVSGKIVLYTAAYE